MDENSAPQAPGAVDLEAAFRAGYDKGEGDAITAHVDGFDVPGVDKHWDAYRASLRPVPAPEGVVEALREGEADAALDAFLRTNGDARRAVSAAVMAVLRLRALASLQPVPQDEAIGRYCSPCGTIHLADFSCPKAVPQEERKSP